MQSRKVFHRNPHYDQGLPVLAEAYIIEDGKLYRIMCGTKHESNMQDLRDFYEHCLYNTKYYPEGTTTILDYPPLVTITPDLPIIPMGHRFLRTDNRGDRKRWSTVRGWYHIASDSVYQRRSAEARVLNVEPYPQLEIYNEVQ